MGTVERMTVTMPAEMAETLRQAVAGGEYASTSEVVREALRDWTRSRDTERRELEALRAAIKAGLDSGPGIPADEVFAELCARYAAKS
ncbi:type II toxin-antitoxin system ParD family antitoxin [Paracoccus kondratievae]|uniref:Transcriptional regulator n=1 Tax=Paracoccus kondratievae TaxID=135740 RepID=A0AAD3P1J9_9RHOB|nr:type II toxin-antitoxin system ParD family antitoxin [Paracoccus kondratievae]GLK65240.1 transcriptional regulator [Paracoccus kondratievae]